jgi:hypothetical protein
MRAGLQKMLALWTAAIGCAAGASAQATLQTEDTTLVFGIADSGPQVRSLRGAEGRMWSNGTAETLPEAVEINGEQVAIQWKWNTAESGFGKTKVVYVFESEPVKLRLKWEWEARTAHGPVEHAIRIENLDTQEVWLPFLDSFRAEWRCEAGSKLDRFSVEKGEGAPSAEGVHLERVKAGERWQGFSSTYAHPEKGEPREIIPWVLVQRADDGQSGWYVGIEFSGRTRLEMERGGDSLRVAAGLNPEPGPFRTRLKTGESFATPTVFLGATAGGVDATGNVLRRWVREELVNPAARENAKYPTLTNNSWGSGMEINEALARRMLRDSAELGFEMFHIDAGWFRGVGDWVPEAKRFPHGLAALADEAHGLGLKFGLWVDWTQAGLSREPGALNARDGETESWTVADTPADWKPEPFKGQTIDIGKPEARAWAERETERIVSEYHLDMLEHDGYLVAQGCARKDHPHAPPDEMNLRIRPAASSFWVESANETDVSYHATHAYYEVQSALRKNHPGLLLEICNDGGRMVDFGSAAHGDYFSITDAYDPVSNRRAFYDTSHVLPAAMLETYVEKWPTPAIENFRYMLRSGMMGWLTIMTDTTAWTEEQHRVAKEEFELYKKKLRPLIREADLYHISARPDGARWDALEYFDAERKQGVVYAFRGSSAERPRMNFKLKGLRREAKYALHFQDGSAADRVLTGQALMESGLRVERRMANSSELVFFSEQR